MDLQFKHGVAGIAALVTAFALVSVSPAQAQKSYKVETTWTLGGDGGWDYLVADSLAHRLYITHGARVEVIDLQSGKSIGAITGLKGTHGVALDDAGKFGYISDGGANTVVVFDRSTLKTEATIPAGTNPDGIAYEPVTRTVWAFNGGSKDVTVIDPASRKVIATVALPGKPEFPVADGKGFLFDNIEDRNAIVKLDAKSPKLIATWPVSPCESPSGLSMDKAGRKLFAVCDEKRMAVVDADSGKVVATPAIGDGPDATSYDPKTKLVFSSNGDGTVTVVDAGSGSYKVLQTLKTQQGARTMTLDPSTGKIYLVTAQSGPRPAATAAKAHPRPSIVPGSFRVIVAGND